jgi:hypothetical protein
MKVCISLTERQTPRTFKCANIYLQETIVRRIGELRLKGVAFDMVWSDEPAGQDRIEYPGVEKGISTASSLKRFCADLRRKPGFDIKPAGRRCRPH